MKSIELWIKMFKREIVKIDLKGRIAIPKHIREEVGLVEGGSALIEIGSDMRSIVIRPLDLKGSLVRIYSEGRRSLEEILKDLREVSPDIELIEIHYIKNGDMHRCNILISTSRENAEKILEKLSPAYTIEKLF
ncbi:MAG: hypothetical protein QXS89_01955 [Sulfolobales archaeon]